MLELPSQNWHEYLDNWCCHGNEAITKLKDGLNPREGDCLLGDWYILLHPEAVNTQNVDVMKVVMCATVSKSFVMYESIPAVPPPPGHPGAFDS